MSLDGSAALVTGVETELGAAVVDRLRASGAKVAAPRMEPTDSADPTAVRQAVDEAVSALGALDVLVTCHARPHVGGWSTAELEEFWTVVDSTLTGTFLFARAAARHMHEHGGRIVLTSSMWHTGGRDLAAVATASGGITTLTKTLARDLGPAGIGVNTVATGLIDTEWLACDAAGLGVDADTLGRSPEAYVPTGDLGTAEQVATTVALLCDPVLPAALGQIVNVNGGFQRTRV